MWWLILRHYAIKSRNPAIKSSNPAMNADENKAKASRRDVLIDAARFGGAALLLTVLPGTARATPASMLAAMKKVIGEASLRKGRVKLELPPLVENGNSVTMVVSVESPMTPADFVKAIHVFNEKNPQPNIISVHLGPRAGKAAISTRVRLADSQKVIAVAEMSDGSFWSDEAEVIVTLAACVEVL
jgi:sulfur-oxidizing protein SoxY